MGDFSKIGWMCVWTKKVYYSNSDFLHDFNKYHIYPNKSPALINAPDSFPAKKCYINCLEFLFAFLTEVAL